MSAQQIVESSPYYCTADYARLQISPEDTYPLVECSVCGFRFAGLVPRQDFLARLYGSSADSDIGSRLAVFARPERMSQQLFVYASILRMLDERIERDHRGVPIRIPRILDYGCGVGAGILSICRPGFPYEGHAVEYSADCLHWLNTQGVHAVSDLRYLNENLQFDALILSDVLEHVADPFELMRQLERRLTPSSVIWVSVPNYIDWRMKVIINQIKAGSVVAKDMNLWEHLSYFTPQSLDLMMAKAGFKRAPQSTVDLRVGTRGGLLQRLTSAVRLARDFWRVQVGRTPSSFETCALFVRG